MTEDEALELLACIEAAYGEGMGGSAELVALVVRLCPSARVADRARGLAYIPSVSSEPSA